MTERSTGAAVRPARLSRSDRRAQLLESARAVFVAQGYHAAGMDGIADAAGVSKPVLYQHFPSKLELYLALLTQSSEQFIEMMRAAIATTSDNALRVEKAVSAYFTFVAARDGAFRLIFESDLRGEPAVEAIVERTSQLCIDELTSTIIADTGLDEHRAQLLASGMVGLSQVSARYWLRQEEDVPQEEAVALMSTLAWRGISRFPRQES